MTGLNDLEVLWPLAITLLVQVSLVLLAGIVLQQIVTRSAAARHAILLWSLIAAGLCTAAFVLRAAGTQAPASFGHSIPFEVPLRPNRTLPLGSIARFAPSHHSFVQITLLLVWAAGAFAGMARLAASLVKIERLRRAKTCARPEKITRLGETIGNGLSQRALTILISEQARVPMALGYWRPVVLLPLSILDLDDRQISQVLMHECAHALRRDALVGVLQRLLSAAFWFHPLMHYSNRLLDRMREEICDNYVLRISSPRDYSNTLLAVAQSLSLPPDGRLAPSICQPAWSLEDRVAGLLHARRCFMTKLTFKKSSAIAIAFLGVTLALSSFTAQPQSQTELQNDFSHVVQMKKTYAGDTITVDEVRGPTDQWIVGNTYEVRGSYRLASRDKARLGAFVTISASHDVHPEALPGQTVAITRGEGGFTLRFHMWQEGEPHVSFYPAEGGNSFGGIYF